MLAQCFTIGFLVVLLYLLRESMWVPDRGGKAVVLDGLQRDGMVLKSRRCAQVATCDYFSDVLVVIHLNPQRLDWVVNVVEYAHTFVPNVMLTSLPHAESIENMTLESRRTFLDYLYLGPDRLPVHLIDNGYGLWGDHNDMVMAMKLYPSYKGYLYWAHDDTLVAFWNYLRFDKDKAWMQAVQGTFSFSHTYPVCAFKYRKWHKHGAKLRMRGGRKCLIPMVPSEARDWVNLEGARQAIRNISEADYQRITPGVTFGIPIYYAPRSIFERLDKYSEILYHARGVNEWSVHILLAAASRNGTETMTAVNIWPGQGKGRFHPYDEFAWGNDFTHPVKANGELFARIIALANTTQLTDKTVRTLTQPDLWHTPFTCDEYPLYGTYGQERKGRFHSCKPGCLHGSSPTNTTSRNGVVCIRNTNSTPPQELPYEGFWNEHSHKAIFSLYRLVNATGQWPAATSDMKA